MGLMHRCLFTGARWLRWIYPQAIWRMKTTEKVLYLTFDDGPIPEVTPFVLQQLAQHQAKATFFVIGDNVQKHPEVFESILAAGHGIGNHTENHLRGSNTSKEDYWANVATCQNRLPGPTRWFRPPYGRLTRQQYHQFLQHEYTLFFWDVLSQDYDAGLSPQACLEGTLQAIRPGSIVVFHDSWKAWPRLEYVLPEFLAEVTKQGYRLEVPLLNIPPIR